MRQRAALYHRVSTVDQNPDAARSELHSAAMRYGLTVALDIEETGSGANNSRPGLLEVMDAARRGKVDAVMVWKLDRFGRSALDLLANLHQLDDCGVRFVAVTQGLDIRPGGDAMSRLLLTMLSAVAAFERDLIVERTKLGMETARRKGTHVGRPAVARPPWDQVRALKSAGHTWTQIADQLGCSVWAARQAIASTSSPAAAPSPAGRSGSEQPKMR